MTKLPVIALGGLCAALVGGAAAAADRNTHVMKVSLPDGSTARVEYVGNVAPKVVVEPSRVADGALWAPLPAFAGFDRMIAEMNRESEAMMRQAQQIAREPSGVATPYVASFGNVPAGTTSTTVVSYTNGSGTCTRSTQIESQGTGKPPKVISSVSGNCAAATAPVQPAPSGAPISHT